ncbi:MAG: hypothetical protein ABJL55_09125 [Roseibium sp.]
MTTIRGLLRVFFLSFFLFATPSIAQQLVDQEAVSGKPTILDPLKGSGFPAESILVDPKPQRPGDSVQLSSDNKLLIYEPKSGAKENTWVSVSVKKSASDKPEKYFFSIAVKEAVSFTDEQTSVIAGQLLLLLVLAILLESALSVIFNYRYFLLFFEGRGVKTPLALVVSLFFVFAFGINTVGEILGAFNLVPKDSWEWPSQIVTALILTGGSGLIFRLFETFGLRAPINRREEAEELRKQARFKVKLIRQVSKGQDVLISVNGNAVGSVKAGEDLAPNSWLNPGYPIESGDQKISLTTYHPVPVKALDKSGKPRVDGDGKPVYETGPDGKVAQKWERAITEVERGFAPDTTVTLSLVL